MTRATERYSLACELVDGAELLVRAAEVDLEAASDPTLRDVAETELRAALSTQDEVAELVAPAIEKRRQEVREAGWAAIRSARGEIGADWMAKHRRWMSPAVKSWLIRRLGRRGYLEGFPW